MLGTAKDTSVRALSCGPECNFECDTSGMSHLCAIIRHRITRVIKRQVHVLGEQLHQIRAVKPPIDLPLLNDFLPDLTLFATGGLCQVIWCVKLLNVGPWARIQGDLCGLLSFEESLNICFDARICSEL